MKKSVKDVFENEDKFSHKTKELIKNNLISVLKNLGLEKNKPEKFAETILEKIYNRNMKIEEIESGIRQFLHENNLDKKIQEKLVNRSDIVYNHVKNKLIGKNILDLGCGDGRVGYFISKQRKNVKLADVIDYNETPLTLDLYDGKILPYADNEIDTTLVLMVLHHCDEPITVLKEAMRVTGKRLVIIESVFLNEEQRRLNIFIDWFYNRVFHSKVNVPFHFDTPSNWERLFRNHGLEIKESTDLGIDLPIVPEQHWLFVLEKHFK